MSHNYNERKASILASLLFLVIFIMFMGGCKTDYTPTPTPSPTITEDDIADMIGASLSGSSSSGGLAAQISEGVTVAGGGSLSKQSAGEHSLIPGFDTTIIRSDTVGSSGYYFTVHYSYNFMNAGDALIFEFQLHGSYYTAFLSSQDTAAALLQFTGITSTDTVYTLNATYSRAGEEVSKVRNHNTFSSVLNLTITNVKISKSTKQLLSGTASISISGKLPDDQFFSYAVTLVVTGPHTVSITINSKSYNIDLDTGVATRI